MSPIEAGRDAHELDDAASRHLGGRGNVLGGRAERSHRQTATTASSYEGPDTCTTADPHSDPN